MNLAFAISMVAVSILDGAAACAQTGEGHGSRSETAIVDASPVFSIEPMPLEQAMLRFSEQAGVQLLMNAVTVPDVRSHAVHGRLPIDVALRTLLSATPLRGRAVGDRIVTIEPDPELAGALAPIRIEGVERDRRAVRPSLDAARWDAQVRTRLQRHRSYPAEAQRRGLEDVVYVRITSDRHGTVLNSLVVNSRRIPLLDDAALAVVRSAGRLPPLPEDLPGSPFSFVVPLVFFLR